MQPKRGILPQQRVRDESATSHPLLYENLLLQQTGSALQSYVSCFYGVIDEVSRWKLGNLDDIDRERRDQRWIVGWGKSIDFTNNSLIIFNSKRKKVMPQKVMK